MKQEAVLKKLRSKKRGIEELLKLRKFKNSEDREFNKLLADKIGELIDEIEFIPPEDEYEYKIVNSKQRENLFRNPIMEILIEEPMINLAILQSFGSTIKTVFVYSEKRR